MDNNTFDFSEPMSFAIMCDPRDYSFMTPRENSIAKALSNSNLGKLKVIMNTNPLISDLVADLIIPKLLLAHSAEFMRFAPNCWGNDNGVRKDPFNINEENFYKDVFYTMDDGSVVVYYLAKISMNFAVSGDASGKSVCMAGTVKVDFDGDGSVYKDIKSAIKACAITI
jgi:hypothetical protein